jgi:hypothetical protein
VRAKCPLPKNIVFKKRAALYHIILGCTALEIRWRFIGEGVSCYTPTTQHKACVRIKIKYGSTEVRVTAAWAMHYKGVRAKFPLYKQIVASKLPGKSKNYNKVPHKHDPQCLKLQKWSCLSIR